MMKLSDFRTVATGVAALETLRVERVRLQQAHDAPDKMNLPHLICNAPIFAFDLPLTPNVYRAIANHLDMKIAEQETALRNLGVEI